MDSDLSRQVAEAMGWRKCLIENGWHLPNDTCSGFVAPRTFDLADARDREAAIAWLRAKGYLLAIYYLSVSVLVTISDRDNIKVSEFADTIGVAFGRAFLGAVGYASTQPVAYHLGLLREQGVVTYTEGLARTIRVVGSRSGEHDGEGGE
jgi:hypothetical protein